MDYIKTFDKLLFLAFANFLSGLAYFRQNGVDSKLR